MEFGGLLKFLQLLQSAEAAGYVTERDVRRKRLRVEGIFRFFSGFFARAFLLRGVGDVLRMTFRRDKNGAREQ